MKYLTSKKGSYKLYQISSSGPYFAGMLVTESAPPGEYIVATSLEEAIEAWKAKPHAQGKRSPTSVRLVTNSLTVVSPE